LDSLTSPADPSVRETETREYGLSHADLERILPRLLAGTPPRHCGNRFEFAVGPAKHVTVILGAELERRIAGLRLPYTVVGFEFEGLAGAERVAFLARFGRAFQKGGG